MFELPAVCTLRSPSLFGLISSYSCIYGMRYPFVFFLDKSRLTTRLFLGILYPTRPSPRGLGFAELGRPAFLLDFLRSGFWRKGCRVLKLVPLELKVKWGGALSYWTPCGWLIGVA